MSAASSTRSLRAAVPAFRSVASSSRLASTYAPRGARLADEIQRPPRPASPSYFTGKPLYGDAMTSLEAALATAQQSLRKVHVWPIPRELPYLQPPTSSWKSWELLNAKQLPMRVKGDYRALISLLNQLNHIRHVANVTGSHDIADQVAAAIEPFEHADRVAAAAAREAARRKAMEEGAGVDELGRVFAMGRRKASSARVWMVPTAQARELFTAPAVAEVEVEVEAEQKPIEIPNAEVLVNHLPLPQHFSRVTDREAVLRPLRITGLLGAYNVFALVRGGGATGQAGAISLAVARALALVRKDAVPALINDNALHRDRRSVERKHTNRVKARKARTWVKR